MRIWVWAFTVVLAVPVGLVAANNPAVAVATPSVVAAPPPDTVSLLAWGTNSSGQLNVPLEVQTGATAVATGYDHALALKDGRVYAWGANIFGETTVPPEAQSGVSAIAAGWHHSLALKNGKVIAWGANSFLEMVVPLEAQAGVTAISAHDSIALALVGDRVIAWGSPNDPSLAVPSEAQSGVTAISAGTTHSLAIKAGRVLAWGSNVWKQLSVPPELASGVTAISAGQLISLAIKDGRTYAWGTDGCGRLTVPLEARAGVELVSAGYSHALAARGGNLAWWDCVMPVPPTEAQSGAIAISSGYDFSLALVRRGASSAPLNVATEARMGAVSVSWAPPSDLGGYPDSSPISYTVVSTPEGKSCELSAAGSLADPACTITGLTDGVGYTFSVVATNAYGTPVAADPSATVTPGEVKPSEPLGVAGLPGADSAQVSWQRPSDRGDYAGPVELTYVATSTPDSLTCSLTQSSAEAAGACTVSGLRRGTEYRFSVTASNRNGVSVVSASSTPVTPGVSGPGAPSAIRAVAGADSAQVAWTPPADVGGYGDVTALAYVVTSSPETHSCRVELPSAATAGQCTVNGLNRGVPYTFRVEAQNAYGRSAATTQAAVTPGVAKPGSPGNVSALALADSAVVKWQTPANVGGYGDVTEITYVVASSPDGATCQVSLPVTALEGQCEVQSLTRGSRYSFRVVAQNVYGPSTYASSSGYILPGAIPPSPPRNVSASAGPDRAIVSWVVPTEVGGFGEPMAIGYHVTSLPDAGSCTVELQSTDRFGNCNIEGLEQGVSYSFRVNATNGYGSSNDSELSPTVIPGVAPPSRPRGVQARPGAGAAFVTWRTPSNVGGYGDRMNMVYTVTSVPDGRWCRVEIASDSSNGSCKVPRLRPGVPYVFTVTAANPYGTSTRSAPSAAVKPGVAPSAPRAVRAQSGHRRLLVTWQAPTQAGTKPVTGYVVTASAVGQSAACQTAGRLNCVVTGLQDATTYKVVVRASNNYGSGAASAAVKAVTGQAVAVVSTAGPKRVFLSTAGSVKVPVTFTVRDTFHAAASYLVDGAQPVRLGVGIAGVIKTKTGWVISTKFRYGQVSRAGCFEAWWTNPRGQQSISILDSRGNLVAGGSRSWIIDCVYPP